MTNKLFFSYCLLFVYFGLCMAENRSFGIEGDNFVKDGKPFQIISGSFHYFRVVPSQWAERIDIMKAAGLNTVQTYVPWSMHQHDPTKFDFSGRLDLVGFINTCAEHGMLVILRGFPYSCAEIDFGGLPSWLLFKNSIVRVRTSDPLFMNSVKKFFAELFPKIVPLLYENGGPVVLVQVENEYGSFGREKEYLMGIRDMIRNELGNNVILHATDGYDPSMMEGAKIDGVFHTVDFGTNTDPAMAFEILRKYQPTGPLMNSEYYTGWFCHWFDEHGPNVPTADVVEGLEKMLELNASVNLYIAVGGTNFGWSNGMNTKNSMNYVQPQITSYDYDAPITEAGDPTDKLSAIRGVLKKFGFPVDILPSSKPKMALGKVKFTKRASILDDAVLNILCPHPLSSPFAQSFEEISQGDGLVLYRTKLPDGVVDCKFHLFDVHDRANVYLNGDYQGVCIRNIVPPPPIELHFAGKSSTLDVLVESFSHINYGPFMMNDMKGLISGAYLDESQLLSNYEIYSLPFSFVPAALPYDSVNTTTGPAVYSGKFNIDTSQAILDTFIELPAFGWQKGIIFVNSMNIGRYWAVGPQYTLYVPADILIHGDNVLEIVEFDGIDSEEAVVEFVDKPRYA